MMSGPDLPQDVERELRDHFSETVFRTVIPRTVRVAEAPSYGIPVTDYSLRQGVPRPILPGRRGDGTWLSGAEWAGPWGRSCRKAPPVPDMRELPVKSIDRNPEQPLTNFSEEAPRGPRRIDPGQRSGPTTIVRPAGRGKYEIIAGERRWRAAQMAGVEKVPW